MMWRSVSSNEQLAFAHFYTNIVSSVSNEHEMLILPLQSQEAIFKYNPKYKGQWSFDALSAFVKVSVPVFKSLNH